MKTRASTRRKPWPAACLALLALAATLAGAEPVLAAADGVQSYQQQQDGSEKRRELSSEKPLDETVDTTGTLEQVTWRLGDLALLVFGNQTIATLSVIPQPPADGKGEPTIRIEIDIQVGELFAALGRRFSGRVDIKAQGSTSQFSGTSIFVHVREGEALFKVVDGKMKVQVGPQERLLEAGAQTLVVRGSAPLPPSPVSRYEPTTLLQSPEELEHRDPPLLDDLDPRIEGPKGGFF